METLGVFDVDDEEEMLALDDLLELIETLGELEIVAEEDILGVRDCEELLDTELVFEMDAELVAEGDCGGVCVTVVLGVVEIVELRVSVADWVGILV